jgi:excisionase family DNA binding protein
VDRSKLPIVRKEEPVVLRVKAAAQRLDISVSQAYVLIERGELEAVRVGGSLRVPVAAIDRIANGERSTGT